MGYCVKRFLRVACFLGLALNASAQVATVTDTLFDRSKYEETFAFGSDVSWLTQQESWKTIYRNRAGKATELMTILQEEQGHNAVRFRVWVNPAGGWSGKQDVITLCKRAHAKGLNILLGFHYSDTWADPGSQTVPAKWTDHSLEALCQNVYDHTYDILSSLKNLGITPKWVQIGNETKRGMLWETGRTNSTQGYKNFAALINSAYKAIKDVDESMLAVIHLPDGHDNSLYRSMFDKLKQYGAQWDVIGMSCYPRWSHLDVTTAANVTSTVNKYISNIKDVKSRYGKPVMVVETGHYNNKPLDANNFLAEFMKALIKEGVLGCFYWEPEAMSGYELGAWDPDTHQASIAMDAFNGIKHVAVDKYVKVTIKTPSETEIQPNGAGIELKVLAKPGSSITKVDKVEFYLNGKKKGTQSEGTSTGYYTFTPDSLADGAYNFHVVAYDNQAHKQVSDTLGFLVGQPLLLDEDCPAWLGVSDDKGKVAATYNKYTGSGYITADKEKDVETSWRVTFPATGKYTLITRYAATDMTSVAFRLDGTSKTIGTFNATGALNKWRFVTKTINIDEPGTYLLQLCSRTTAGLPNIDYVAVLSPNPLNPATAAINEVDAIQPIHISPEPNHIYDLQGRCIDKPSCQLYIKNGKKYLKRTDK